MKAQFKVQHEILAGLKYLQKVTRMGVSNKMQEMMGSYGPSTEEKPFYEKKCKYNILSYHHPTHTNSPTLTHIPLTPPSRARDGPLWHARPRPLLGPLQVCRRRQPGPPAVQVVL